MQGRVRFAGVVVRKEYLDAHMWLRRRVDHPRLVRIESYGNLAVVHHFRLDDPEDIDEAMIELLREAYIVGQQD